MKIATKYIVVGICCLVFVSTSHSSWAQQRGRKTTIDKSAVPTGAQDREYWVKVLYKIAYPVVHSLAEGELKKNLPLELAPNYGLRAGRVTYLEAVGRTMAGIAPWLALPDDESPEGAIRRKLRTELLKGLANGVDPANPDYLDFRTENQAIVDAAFMAHAFLRAPDALWKPLDSITKKRFVEEFKSLRNRAAGYNNWLLFSGIIEGFLLSIGEQYDPVRIEFALHKMREWYAGDGWYKDGEKFSMDYYNSYVIHPMLVDLLGVLSNSKYQGGHYADHKEYEIALKRMIRHAEFLERIISPEGTYPAFGRSITYRTAAFQALAQVALMEKLPEEITPAQVRCALTKVFYNMYDGDQNFDSRGWLVLGFNGHQPTIADVYTSTGSLYMATLGFLPLGLPASNRFWTDAPADWTSRKAWKGLPVRKDYKVEW